MVAISDYSKVKPNCFVVAIVFTVQASKTVTLEQNVKRENETIKGLEQKIAQDKVSQNE